MWYTIDTEDGQVMEEFNVAEELHLSDEMTCEQITDSVMNYVFSNHKEPQHVAT